MAEVKKEVLNHINVMARPWVLLGKDYHRLMWTGLSADVDVGKGYKFVTSLSRPVYNLKNYTVTLQNVMKDEQQKVNFEFLSTWIDLV